MVKRTSIKYNKKTARAVTTMLKEEERKVNEREKKNSKRMAEEERERSLTDKGRKEIVAHQ